MIQYKLVSDQAGGQNLTIFIPGYPTPLLAHSSHPRWEELRQLVEQETEMDMVDIAILLEGFGSSESAGEILSKMLEADDDWFDS